jgi:iron complex outermembrane receptor protein
MSNNLVAHKIGVLYGGVIFLSIVIAASSAGAEDAPAVSGTRAQTSSDTIEEIVVTAQRREENAQRVPIAVTALSTADLEQKQVTNVVDLAQFAPGMDAKPTISPNEISIAIRGVTQLQPSISADPPIGAYVDGLYNAVGGAENTSMIDMERVEVLNGPQGTLFGRNTIGGAVSITTNKPTNKLEGYAQFDIGNYGAKTYTAVGNIPIVSDVVDARLVYQHTGHDGYGNNFTLGTPVDTLDQNYLRGSLKIDPSSDLDILLTGALLHSEGNSMASKLTYIDPGTSLINTVLPLLAGHPGQLLSSYINMPGVGFQDSVASTSSTFSLKQQSVAATITDKLSEGVTLKSITGYINTYNSQTSDLGGTPYIIISVFDFPIKTKQVSEELQAYGDAIDNRLRWITGLYYYSESGMDTGITQAVPEFTAPGSPLTYNSSGPVPAINKSYAAYAQGTYEVIPDLRLTGGIRWTKDTRSVTFDDHAETVAASAFTTCALANAPAATALNECTYSNSVKYHYFPWTAGIDYTASPDILVYAKVSKGYRSGSWPISGPQAAGSAAQDAAIVATYAPAAPESLLSPEIGAKMEFLDHRLRLNTALYYSDYKNIQVQVNLPQACPTCSVIEITANSGEAHIYGGELQANAVLGNLRLDGTLGITRPKYVEGPGVGTEVINVSKTTWSVAASYLIKTDAGVLSLSPNYSWRSSEEYESVPPGVNPAVLNGLTQNGFGLVGARIAFDMSHIPLTLALYGVNLANKEYFASAAAFAPPLSFATGWVGPPRTFGLSARYSF